MSLDYINKSETTVKMVDGVKFWSNPSVTVTINSIGNVFNEDGSLVKKYKSNTYTIRIKVKNKFIAWTASYASLFARMVLGVKLGNKTLKLRDESKGWDEDNITFVGTTIKTIKDLSVITSEKVCENQSKPVDNNIHYTTTKGVSSWVTEDGAVFPTEELANWHQNRVSKGKGNAQVVLDYNGGYVLAEQIYLQEVVYNKKKPYVNFSDVMSNNKGVVCENGDDEHKFTTRNIPSDLIYRTTFSFERLNHFVCYDKVKVDELNKKINSMILVYQSFVGINEDILNMIK